MKERKISKGLVFRIIVYLLGYWTITIVFPILPIGLVMCFKLIVGYSISTKDFVPDITIAIVGIIASSFWGTLWLDKHYPSEIKMFVILLQVLAMAVGLIIYAIIFGVIQLSIDIDINSSVPVSVFLGCGIVLLLNTIWDSIREVKAHYGHAVQSTKEGD